MKPKINKGRRLELKMLKYKRRLRILRLKQGIGINGQSLNYYAYRSHGKPCSCIMCSPYKYNRAKVKRELLNGLK